MDDELSDEEAEELYRDALDAIETAQREREETYPKIEALRRQWKETVVDELEDPKDPIWIGVAIDHYTREIEEILDDEAEDPVDPDEWLEYA